MIFDDVVIMRPRRRKLSVLLDSPTDFLKVRRQKLLNCLIARRTLP
jgi:hypothetical protein